MLRFCADQSLAGWSLHGKGDVAMVLLYQSTPWVGVTTSRHRLSLTPEQGCHCIGTYLLPASSPKRLSPWTSCDTSLQTTRSHRHSSVRSGHYMPSSSPRKSHKRTHSVKERQTDGSLSQQWAGITYAWGSWRIIFLFIVFGVLLTAFIAVQIWQGEAATGRILATTK